MMRYRPSAETRSNALRLLAVASVLLLVPAAMSFAGGEHEGVVNTTDGVAIEGYDPVAYLTLGEPTQGSDAYVHEWDGAQWWFASAEHLGMFEADPQRYAPRYGGYCSFAATRNEIAADRALASPFLRTSSRPWRASPVLDCPILPLFPSLLCRCRRVVDHGFNINLA
ncbi:MAG: YHS domain-containing (seleno)protein [Spirochaetota bacterium]